MQLAYTINLVIHALAGLAAFSALPVPLIARKGGAAHRKAGWVFVVAMIIVSITGMAIAASWAIAPLSVMPPSGTPSPEDIARMERWYRSFSLFFATVAVISAAAVRHGLSALRLRREDPGSWARPADHLAYAATVACGAPLLWLGLRSQSALFIAFGALALVGGLADGHFVLWGCHKPKAWLIRHLQSMLGGATAAITAFSALTLRRYLGGGAGFALAAWLVPVVLGTGASIIWTRVYERKLRPRRV